MNLNEMNNHSVSQSPLHVMQYTLSCNHQPARLNGGTDENGNVMMVSDGFMYPDVDRIIKVTIVKM